MNTNKNSYTIIYAVVMVIIVAFMLAFVSGTLKERQTNNINIDKKKQILLSLNIDTEGADIEKLYNEKITDGFTINKKGEILSKSKERAFGIDMKKELALPEDKRELPIYEATIDGEVKYIFTVQGTGLWGPIWGYISLDSDKNKIYGTYFSHAGETPGLGAEIATRHFQNEFVGKKIKNSENKFVSVAVVKSGKSVSDRDYVDGISGGTITSKGVEAMLFNSLGQYDAFFNQTNEKGESK